MSELKGLIFLALLASLAGVIRPFLAGTRRWHYVVGGLVSAVLVGALSGQGEFGEAASGAMTAKAVSAPTSCEGGGQAINREVAVSHETPLLSTWGETGERIVNQKATNVMGETQYQQVDQTERLRETCRQGQWSKVAVLEPEWLTEVEG